jgi:hypothetical protein
MWTRRRRPVPEPVRSAVTFVGLSVETGVVRSALADDEIYSSHGSGGSGARYQGNPRSSHKNDADARVTFMIRCMRAAKANGEWAAKLYALPRPSSSRV